MQLLGSGQICANGKKVNVSHVTYTDVFDCIKLITLLLDLRKLEFDEKKVIWKNKEKKSHELENKIMSLITKQENIIWGVEDYIAIADRSSQLVINLIARGLSSVYKDFLPGFVKLINTTVDKFNSLFKDDEFTSVLQKVKLLYLFGIIWRMEKGTDKNIFYSIREKMVRKFDNYYDELNKNIVSNNTKNEDKIEKCIEYCTKTFDLDSPRFYDNILKELGIKYKDVFRHDFKRLYFIIEFFENSIKDIKSELDAVGKLCLSKELSEKEIEDYSRAITDFTVSNCHEISASAGDSDKCRRIVLDALFLDKNECSKLVSFVSGVFERFSNFEQIDRDLFNLLVGGFFDGFFDRMKEVNITSLIEFKDRVGDISIPGNSDIPKQTNDTKGKVKDDDNDDR